MLNVVRNLDVEVLQHGAGVIAAFRSEAELSANLGIDAVACDERFHRDPGNEWLRAAFAQLF